MATLTFLSGLAVAAPPAAGAGRCAARVAAGAASRCRNRVTPRPTRTVLIAANLGADAPVFPGGFLADGTFESAFETTSFGMSINVLDELGLPREMLLFFTRTRADVWNVNVGVEGGSGEGGSGQLLTGEAEGTLVFGPRGRLRRGRMLRLRVPSRDGASARLVLDSREVTQRLQPTGATCVFVDGCP